MGEHHRARDGDRDRFAALVEAAYADGQLSEPDRELRLSRVRTSETVAELEALTRDLRPVAPRQRSVPAPRSGVRARGARWAGGVVVGAMVLLGVIGVGVAGLVALFALAVGPTSTVGPSVTESPTAVVVGDGEPFTMDVRGVRAFVHAYEEQHGTTRARQVVLHPHRVTAQVPTGRAQVATWRWDGAWRQLAPPRAAPGPPADLGELDVRRLVANMDRVGAMVDVRRGRVTHVSLEGWFDGVPSVTIHVSNEAGDVGQLVTTFDGEVVGTAP